MRKIPILFILILMIFVLPTSVSASTYYNEDLKYTVSFSDEWGKLTKETKSGITPEETEGNVEIFVNSGANAQLFINHYLSTDKQTSFYNEIIRYVNSTPEAERDYTKIINKIQPALGLSVNELHVSQNTVYIRGSQSSSSFGKTIQYIRWDYHEETLIELSLFLFDVSQKDENEGKNIMNSFNFTERKTTTSINDGDFTYGEKPTHVNDTTSRNTEPDSLLMKIIEKVSTPTYGIGIFIILVVWIIGKTCFRRF